jgi:hypothetical protein
MMEWALAGLTSHVLRGDVRTDALTIDLRAEVAFDRPLATCVGILQPALHILYFHQCERARGDVPNDRRR